jgi:chromosome segregation ATPase
MDDLRAELARLEAEMQARRAAGVVDPLESAQERTEVALARVVRDEEAAADMVALSGQLEAATDAERQAVARRDAAEAALADAIRERESADARLTVAEHELEEAVRLQNQAAQELRRLEDTSGAQELARLVATVGEREEQLHHAQQELAQVRAAAAEVEAERTALVNDLDELARRLGDAGGVYIDPLKAPVDDDDPGTEDIEWYLLARLAGQRGVSYAGSVPLLLDDTLRDLHPIEVDQLLERLERMADAVQLIVLADSDAVASWAQSSPRERVAMVAPSASA